MTAQIRFIHTADLHLGAPLNCGGKPPTQLSALFNQSGYQAFERLVDSALKYGVDFVLIAGDLYDREARSVKAARFFTGQCQRLQEEEISVYIISGNHDPLGGAREPFSLPENVHIFSCDEVEEKEHTDSGGRVLARLLGQSYRQKFESRKMCTYYNPSAGDSFNIGLLHTQLEPQNNHYVPVAAAELLSKDNIDYWALGHIHQPRIVHSALPYIIYPGTPQGRDINEEGVRGCFLIEVAGKKEPELNFIPLSPVIYKKITVDISTNRGQQVQNLSKLEEILQDKAEGLLKKRPFTEHSFPASEVAAVKENDAEEGDKGQTDISNIQENKASPGGIFRGYIVRWSITGRTPLHEIIEDNREEATAEILNKLNDNFSGGQPFIWSHSLDFHTGRELPELEELLENNELFQEIEKLIIEIKDGTELEAEFLNSWGRIWEGSAEHEEEELERFFPDQDTRELIIEEAKQRIIEELVERGESQ